MVVSNPMARISRIVVPNYPYHIVQRGNNKQRVFFDDEDRERYLQLIRWYTKKWKCSVFAYSLMPNHIHLLVKPSKDIGLAKTMQGIGLCHTQSINRKYRRTGRLWECRYYSCIVNEDAYLWSVIRYIDWNSVRAGLAKEPQVYRWSSARAHILGVEDPLLSLGELPGYENTDEYRDFIQKRGTQKEIDRIRRVTRKGLPLGDQNFVREVEMKTNRNLTGKNRGRPRKTKHFKNGMCP